MRPTTSLDFAAGSVGADGVRRSRRRGRRADTSAWRRLGRQLPAEGSAPTAAVLLAHFGTLDALLARIDEVQFLRFRGAAQAAVRLRQHREQALLCRRLATIACDAPVGDAAPVFARAAADGAAIAALCERLRFGPLTRRRLYAAAGLEYLPPQADADPMDAAIAGTMPA